MPAKNQIDLEQAKPYLSYMFDEELPKKQTADFPRNLETMSVAELNDYIADLKDEITRVEADIAKKKASQDAAASIFKS